MEEKQFPNGFHSWMEVHHEVVSFIAIQASSLHPIDIVGEVQFMEGTTGLYILGEELTDRFEEKYQGRVWDGDFFDVIDEFLTNELTAKG